jgi:hypothetical protein
MLEENFSEWKRWESRNDLSNLKYPGIYIIAKSDQDFSGKNFEWEQEIIYIGMTNAQGGLKSRLKQFDQTLKGKIKHGGADRVLCKHRDYEALVKKLYVSVFQVKCDVKSNQPEDLRHMGDILRLELFCFAEYVERYGKLSEFNDKKASPKYSLQNKYD